MKKTIFYLLSVILLMTGCVKPEVTNSFMRKVVINAGIETDTKAAVSETGKFSWQADDCISIMATDGNFYTFTLKSGAGDKYAMFEPIHGSAPRLIEAGRGDYANPTSMFKATEMMLRHIGFIDKANKLNQALNICTETEKKVVVDDSENSATCSQFGDYLMETIEKL